MKKTTVIIAISLLLCSALSACSATTSNNEDFADRMMEEDAEVSLIYNQSIYYPSIDFGVDLPTVKHPLNPDFTNLDNQKELGVYTGECTSEQFDQDAEIFYEKQNELLEKYADIISGLTSAPDDQETNYNDLLVGIECKDDQLSTAYLYSNKVMKIQIDDKVQYYVLSDEDYDRILSAYYIYITEYLMNSSNCPCWNRSFAEFYTDDIVDPSK